jgi:hypothetical protein
VGEGGGVRGVAQAQSARDAIRPHPGHTGSCSRATACLRP